MGRNIKNEIGNKYGRLEVLGLVGVVKRNSGKTTAVWNCLCDCGNTKEVRQSNLRTTRSCGCLRKDELSDRRFKNEIDNRYGKLTVLRLAKISPKGFMIWECLCDCGNKYEAVGTRLRNGATKSCGCLPKGRKKTTNQENR